MTRAARRLGPMSIAGIGCSVLFVGCCAWSVTANVFFALVGPPASAPPPVAWSPPPPVAAPPPIPQPIPPPPVIAPVVGAPEPTPFADTLGRGERQVTRTDLGDQWPLTVQRGTLRCRREGALQIVTFEAPLGRVYAVNGAAAPYAADIEPIWAPSRDPFLRGTGARVPITSLINVGRALCP